MNDDAVKAVVREVSGWPNVRSEAHAGGVGQGGWILPPFTSLLLGRKEIGHIHEGGEAHLTFTRAIHDELVASGKAHPHGAGFPGVVSYAIATASDVPEAIALFRLNYERLWAVAARQGPPVSS